MSSGRPSEQATTIRYPPVALLCVDSADGERFDRDGYRVDSNQPNRIYINNQQPLSFGYMTRVSLTEFNIQWNTPNVNARNNTFTVAILNGVNSQSGTFTVTVDENFYTPSELCSALQTKLNNNTGIRTLLNVTTGSPFTVSVDNRLRVTIAETTPVAGFDSFSFSIVPPKPYNQDLTDMLGLTPFGPPDFLTSITGGYASFQYTPYIDITSNLLTKNQNIQDGDSAKTTTGQKLARIYLSNEDIVNRYEKLIPTYNTSGVINGATYDTNIVGCRSFVFKREFKTPKVIQWNNTENIDAIDIEVLDYKGQPLYISPQELQYGLSLNQGNTADVQFTIQVTEV